MKTMIVEEQPALATQRRESKQKQAPINELDWKTYAGICPVCGNEMFLVNGFHRCAECGFKESCCYA